MTGDRTMNKINVAILAGGSSVEREVSLKSCENIVSTLDGQKYDIKVYTLPKDGSTQWAKEIVTNPPDIVLSALHGGRGENGSLQGFLHCLGIPFVGSRVLSCALCMDKKMAKTVMTANHIQVAPDIYIKREEEPKEHREAIAATGFPLIVKPNRGGSSIGIEVVNDMQELEAAFKSIVNKYDDDVIAEKYINGREITCGVMENTDGIEVMAVLDVNKSGDIFDYEDKAQSTAAIGDISNMPEFQKAMVEAISIKTFKALKCRGYACVDMIVKEEQIYVLEVNTLPGLTKQSLIPEAAQSLEGGFGEFLDRLIEFELEKHRRA